MKKTKINNVAIVTLYGNNNYGNKLQNYALQQFLKRYANNVDTLINYPETNRKNKYYINQLRKKIYNIKHKNTINKNRLKFFLNFNSNISYNKNKITAKNYKKFNYDFFVTGSDQVWNPAYGLNDIELLSFAENKKRISFAASFGVSDIDEKSINRIKQELPKFNSISVREDAGKKIIEKYTNLDNVEILIDPTMLLDANEWDKVSKKPEQLKNNKYVLCYFLGELNNIKQELIKKFADKHNCEIINLLDQTSPFYETGPSEFLYLEKNAYMIFTDSFHSSVFSILYQKPFVVFGRTEKSFDSNYNMNSRINTLLEKFQLNNRYIDETIILDDDILNIDYTKTNKILEQERRKCDKFIERGFYEK